MLLKERLIKGLHAAEDWLHATILLKEPEDGSAGFWLVTAQQVPATSK